jgi:hypothetical protein
MIILRGREKDEDQDIHLGILQAEFEQRMGVTRPAAKSLNISEVTNWRKMFPEYCPSDASQSGNTRQLETY